MNNNTSIRKTTYTSDTAMIIVGVLSLAFIAVYLYNYYKTMKANILANAISISPMCPDYWDSIGNSKCQNVNSLGSCSKTDGANIMDFSSEVFTNENTGNYAKCKWAKACNVSWSNIDRVC